MKRKMLAAVAMATCTGVLALASARATFIMTNGTRQSGEVVFHGGQGNNLIDGQLNLGDNGKETSYPVESVAVIDFAGGTPAQAELSKALGASQALAMRNGTVQPGEFVNVQHGDTVVWRDANGQVQRYPAADVARIYLNTSSARGIFNYTGPTTPAPAVGTTGSRGAGATPAAAPQAEAPMPAGAIRVPGNQPWTQTGIRVRAGDMVTFHATGQVTFAIGGEAVDPQGKTGETSPKYPIPAMQVGGLIGKVANSAPFPIGLSTAPIRMPADGVLMLGINDDYWQDNGGAFAVVVQVTSRGR